MKSTGKPEIYTALLVDDEQIALDHLSALLHEFPRFRITVKTTRSSEVIPLIKTTRPDLVFLDIQMPGKNGLELLKEISLLDDPPRVIMVTAYDQFILDALRNNAFDYLLKPCDEEELARLIDRLDHTFHQDDEKRNIGKLLSALSHKIQVRGVYEDYFFAPSDICYLEAEGKYTRFYLVSQKPVLSSQNLHLYEKDLPGESFLRISKSCIINTGFVSRVDKKKKVIILRTGETETHLKYSGLYVEGKNY